MAIAKVMEQNPQLTPEQLASGKAFQERFASIMIVLGVPVAVLLIGLVLWMAGKVVGAVQRSPHHGRRVQFLPAHRRAPRRAAALFFRRQLTGRGALSIGPARFLDDTASPILSAPARADVFTLWITVLQPSASGHGHIPGRALIRRRDCSSAAQPHRLMRMAG
jgi:hypothetical protein